MLSANIPVEDGMFAMALQLLVLVESKGDWEDENGYSDWL
jgi:hypothetical protein